LYNSVDSLLSTFKRAKSAKTVAISAKIKRNQTNRIKRMKINNNKWNDLLVSTSKSSGLERSASVYFSWAASKSLS
jgi:hypothetical protein